MTHFNYPNGKTNYDTYGQARLKYSFTSWRHNRVGVLEYSSITLHGLRKYDIVIGIIIKYD